jgi:SAM-dependent methyltransferase
MGKDNYAKSEVISKSLYAPEYSQNYRKYDEVYSKDMDFKHYADILSNLTLTFGHPIEVLDIGCGTGRYFHALQNVKYLLGVDVSEHMLHEAENPLYKDKVNIPSIRLVQGNIFTNDLTSDKFDFIYSVGVLGEHTPFDQNACQKIYSLLKPAGMAYFTIVDLDERKSFKRKIVELMYPFLFPWLKKKLTKRWEINYLTHKQLKNILDNSMFKDCKIFRHNSVSNLWKGAHYECILKKEASAK